MNTYYLKDIDGPVWEPLERLAELTVTSPDLPVIDPGHFMYMVRIQAPGLADINLYKHYYTRRYLNLDDQGHAYRYIDRGSCDIELDEPSDYMGEYEPLPDLVTALARLNLGFLRSAWMTDEDRASLKARVQRSRKLERQQREAAL